MSTSVRKSMIQNNVVRAEKQAAAEYTESTIIYIGRQQKNMRVNTNNTQNYGHFAY